MWPFKPKLKLNFYDPEYDTLMDFFKQVNYLNKIADAILDRYSNASYVISLMQAFKIIYGQLGAKILSTHKKKVLDFHRFNQEQFNQELMESGVDPSATSTFDHESLELLYEIHSVRREHRYNKIVSETYMKTLNSIVKFARRCDEYDNQSHNDQPSYQYYLIDFLKTINNSLDLYDKIGKWLREDRTSIDKYKKILGAKVQKQSKHAVIQIN